MIEQRREEPEYLEVIGGRCFLHWNYEFVVFHCFVIATAHEATLGLEL